MQPTPLILILLGVFVGGVSGLIGIGGGVVLVPLLVLLFNTPPHLAQGTSLAMLLPPVGVLAVYGYYKRGQVDVGMAAWLCLGFLAGGLLGAHLAGMLSPLALRRVFGAALFAISVRMMFF